LAHANRSPKKSCQPDSKMSNLRNHSMTDGGNQPLERHLSSKRSISCKSLSFALFSARCRNPKEFWGEAVDVIRSMSTIMSGLSRGRCPYGCSLPSEIFCSGVAELRKEPKILGSELLFDNLVSDLQFFCQPKTVQAEVLRTNSGEQSLAVRSSNFRQQKLQMALQLAGI
jgi:hypothetical protein